MVIPRTKTASRSPTATRTVTNSIKGLRYLKCAFFASMSCIKSSTVSKVTLSRSTSASPIPPCKTFPSPRSKGNCFISIHFSQPTLCDMENWTRPTIARLHRHLFGAEPAFRLEGVCADQCVEGFTLRSDLVRWASSPDGLCFHSTGELS